MYVVFRVDGGIRLGLGNINRCLSIAKSLSQKKVNCIFLISNSTVSNILKKTSYKIIILKKNESEISLIQKLILDKKCDVLIIDSKRKAVTKIVSKFMSKIKVVLIDNTEVVEEVDLRILPGVKEQFTKKYQKSVVGEKFILMNPNLELNKKVKKDDSIFLSMGSTDKFNITASVVSSFLKTKLSFKIIIIIGPFNKHGGKIKKMVKNDKRFLVLTNPLKIHKIISKCKLGIISFGITCYETMALDLPIFVIAHNNSNNVTSKKLEKYRNYKHLGKYNEIDYSNIPKIICQNKKNGIKKRKIAIDGKGPIRVAQKILKLLEK